MFPHPTSRKIARLQAFSRKLLLMRLTPAWELRENRESVRNPLESLIFLERFSYFGAERREISLFLAVNRENRAQCPRMWSASHAADIVKPPVFASSNGVLDLL